MMLPGILRRSFIENPLVGRQLAAQLTGARLGLALFMVTVALLLADSIFFATVLLSGEAAIVEGGAGAYLHLINSVILYGILVLFLPIRLAGAIDGPRFDKAFDQIVVTGVSPLRLQLGNWALAFAYALTILLASLPFQVYACMLGGVSVAGLLGDYWLLAVYSNVIIATTLGIAVFEREWLAVPVTIGFFALAGLLGPSPMPNVFGLATPVRLWMLELGLRLGQVPQWWGDPVLFLTTIPTTAFAYLLWGLMVVPWVVWLFLGPAHRFVPGLNNFGNVVLPGDRKRRIFRKLRFALTRKVELAFLYENSPRWLQTWAFPLRVLVGLGAVAFAWAVIVGLCFAGHPMPDSRFDLSRDQAMLVSIHVTAVVALAALLFLIDPRGSVASRERVGRWSVPRAFALAPIALLFIGGFALLHVGIIHSAVDSARATAADARALAQIEAYETRAWQLVAAVTLFLINFYLLSQALSRVFRAAAPIRFLTCLTAAAVIVGPFILGTGIAEHWVPRDSFRLVLATPEIVIIGHDSYFLKQIAPQGFTEEAVFSGHLTWSVGTLAILIALLCLLHFGLRRLRGRGAAALLLLCGALASSRLGAQTEHAPLRLEARVVHGFDGELFNAGADFFTVNLKNPGAEAVTGELHLETDEGESLGVRRAFEAPGGTTTVIRWTQSSPDPYSVYRGNRLLLVLESAGGRLELPVEAIHGTSADNQGNTAEYLVVTEDGSSYRGALDNRRWVRSTAGALPEDPRPYAGAKSVFVSAMDLSRWTRGQRRALYDYVRLGGVVIFYGALDRNALAATDEWARLLETRSSSRFTRGDVDLSVEDLEGGETTWRIDFGDGQPPAPILSLKEVGPGRIGHLHWPLSHDLVRSGASDPRSSARRFWMEFDGHVPQSRFPVQFAGSRALDIQLRDSTSLLAVFCYFAAYVVAIGPVVMVVFRKRPRRRWLWAAALVVPTAFTVFLPALHASLHLRPSFAALTRVTYFGPGAGRGVAVAWLHVRSSGRQRHSITVEGRDVSAFSFSEWEATRAPGVGTALAPFPPVAAEGARSRFDVTLNPWGERQVCLVGDVDLASPVVGRATYNASSMDLTIEARGLPVAGAKPEGQCIVRVAKDSSPIVAYLASATWEDGVLRLSLNKLERESAPAPDSTVAFSLPDRPFALLVIRGAPPGVTLQSTDLAFERVLSDVDLQAYRNWPIDPSKRQKTGYVERDGKVFRSFDKSLILQELPLEVR